MSHPKMGAKMGNAKYCAELKMAEARPRSDVGNQEATMRPLPGKTAIERDRRARGDEDRREGGAGGEVTGESGEKGAHRPADDGDSVDAFRSETVEQAARGNWPSA